MPAKSKHLGGVLISWISIQRYEGKTESMLTTRTSSCTRLAVTSADLASINDLRASSRHCVMVDRVSN